MCSYLFAWICFVATVEIMKTNRLAKTAAAGSLAIAFALAGCSGTDSGDSENKDSKGEETQSQPDETESADDEDSDDAESDDDDSDDAESSESKKSDSSGLAQDADLSQETPSVSPEDAIAAAKKKASGTVHGIELEYHSSKGAWQYEVKILDGSTDYDIEIDAETGKVVDVDKDSTDDKEKGIDLKDPMTFDEALELAQDKASGRLESWKLEYDDGRIKYQFDFEDSGEDTEISVDVKTKKVVVDD